MSRFIVFLRRSASLTCLLAGFVLAACTPQTDRAYYANLASNLYASGHLRLDRAPADAPYTAEDLARTFEEVVFRYEFHFDGANLVNAPLVKPLKRWSGTIRYRLAGDAVTQGDKAEVAALLDEISYLTGLPFVQVDDVQNDMLISIASRYGREQIAAGLTRSGRPVYRERYDIWRRTPGWICGATLSSDKADPNRLVHAHIFIGSEVHGILRRSCLHEEIVQSLGLTNDSDTARPSIFNDDQEFVLMTEHDALLLRALYDPRLLPGMSAAEAMPIARRIFADLVPAP